MPIQHLLYRCPQCGQDPTTTRKGVRCDSCGTTFEQGRLSVILVRSADGTVEETSARALMDAIDRWGGPSPAAQEQGGELSYETSVVAARAKHYEAIRWKGALLGFWEKFAKRRNATLRLGDAGLALTSTGREPLVWLWASILAIQVSSRSIQLDIRGDGLYQIDFLVDSPKRWEELLEGALRRYYAEQGQTVVEFQPRIVTRPRS